jgi:predicted Zn-dependent peptidase
MSIVNLPSPTDLSGFYVVYKGSTNLEKKGIYGISHLMEHLVCKAVDPYQDELDTLGITHNAYTTGNEIVFWLRGLDESLSKWRNKYIDLLTDFNVTKEEFENERNIVLQEYMDSFNDQSSNHFLNLERKILNKYNPIGLREDLENLTYMDCLNYFEKQYLSPSKIINVSKNIEFGVDMDFMEPKTDIEYKLGKYPYVLERSNDYNNKVSFVMYSDLIKEDFNKISFVNNMLSYGLQSPFYQEIREKRGLVYYIGMHLDRMNNQGMNSIYTMTSEENVDKIVEIIETIFGDIHSFLSKERFDVIKSSTKLKLKEKEINRYANVNEYISPEGWSLSEIIDDIEYIDVLKTADKYFKMENFTLSRDDKEFN